MKSFFLGLSLMFMMTAAAPLASADEHVRWDIATVTTTSGGFPIALYPKGSAVAMAVDCLFPAGCSFITLTGSGTFVAPESGGPSTQVTGGGTWQVSASCNVSSPTTTPPPTCSGGIITKGTFVVTELIEWQKAEPLDVPACFNTDCETTDYIDNVREATGGLAVLRVRYSDGTTGVITLACSGLPDPAPVLEGVTASKEVKLSNVAIPGINVPPLPADFKTSEVLVPVMFWYTGPDVYNVEFHVN
jgi:hypothetical protein